MDTFTPQSYVEHSFLIYYMNNKNQVEKKILKSIGTNMTTFNVAR